MRHLRRFGWFRSFVYTLTVALALGGLVHAAVGRALPTANQDSSQNTLPSRAGRYLEAYTIPLGAGKTWANADEGGYYCTYNVTDGTGIAGHAAPVQADLSTKPLLHMFNGSSTLRLYIDFVRIRMTAIGAGATTTDFTAWVDNNGSTVKTSGGTVATVVNTLGGGSADGDTVVSFGAVVATAGATEKRVDHQRVRSVVPVVEDQYTFGFGGVVPAFPAAMALTGTAVVSAYVHMPPVVVPPGGNFKLVEWGASQTGAHSAEFTVCYARR
jgi:hypothetical protein